MIYKQSKQYGNSLFSLSPSQLDKRLLLKGRRGMLFFCNIYLIYIFLVYIKQVGINKWFYTQNITNKTYLICLTSTSLQFYSLLHCWCEMCCYCSASAAAVGDTLLPIPFEWDIFLFLALYFLRLWWWNGISKVEIL